MADMGAAAVSTDAVVAAACAAASCCASSASRSSPAAAAALTSLSSASARCSCRRASSACCARGRALEVLLRAVTQVLQHMGRTGADRPRDGQQVHGTVGADNSVISMWTPKCLRPYYAHQTAKWITVERQFVRNRQLTVSALASASRASSCAPRSASRTSASSAAESAATCHPMQVVSRMCIYRYMCHAHAAWTATESS
jgi:hypothetical protein